MIQALLMAFSRLQAGGGQYTLHPQLPYLLYHNFSKKDYEIHPRLRSGRPQGNAPADNSLSENIPHLGGYRRAGQEIRNTDNENGH